MFGIQSELSNHTGSVHFWAFFSVLMQKLKISQDTFWESNMAMGNQFFFEL